MSDIDDCRKSVERLTRDRGEVMSAGNDKIAEIRARHERVQRDGDLATPPGSMAGQVAAVDAHDDRATLLAEVERLRAALRRIGMPLNKVAFCRDGHEIAVLLARNALEGKP